jgi:hypothetical protein
MPLHYTSIVSLHRAFGIIRAALNREQRNSNSSPETINSLQSILKQLGSLFDGQMPDDEYIKKPGRRKGQLNRGRISEFEKATNAEKKALSGLSTAHNSGVSPLPTPTTNSSPIDTAFEMYENAYSVQDMSGSIWGRFLEAYSALNTNDQDILYNKICGYYDKSPPWGFSEVVE